MKRRTYDNVIVRPLLQANFELVKSRSVNCSNNHVFLFAYVMGNEIFKLV